MELEQRITRQSNLITNLTLLIPLTEDVQRHEYQRDLRIAEAELDWLNEGKRLSQSTDPADQSRWGYWQSVDCAKRQQQQLHLQQQLQQQLHAWR